MADYATQISDLPLYQELDRAAGRDAIGPTDVARLKGLVNEVADTAGPAMAQIPVTFRQYTVHDIRHCRNVIARMGDIIPAETREKLNALEITFLLLSALLHDVGMVVTDHEKAETLLSENFRRFRAEGHADRNKAIEEARAAGNDPRARAILQNGRSPDWRKWFCVLADGAVEQSLNTAAFAKLYGQLVEDACGLAVGVKSTTTYLSRAEVLELIPGPIYFADNRHTVGLVKGDPVNRLLCSFDKPHWSEEVEVDLSSLPLVRVEK